MVDKLGHAVVSIMNFELITNSLVHMCCHYSFSVHHKGILMIFIGDCIHKGCNYNVLGERLYRVYGVMTCNQPLWVWPFVVQSSMSIIIPLRFTLL